MFSVWLNTQIVLSNTEMTDRQKDILAWQIACELNPGLQAHMTECLERPDHPNIYAARKTYKNQLKEVASIIRPYLDNR